ncbi:MAG TPA: nuclear transport factor 2 family protein [Acidimicrobiia bacterium]|nr:nuclear transport factor 2 family protein [Acidimicrobiia bacterium]
MHAALDRYFDAWNDQDPAGVVQALTADGTYEDPVTGGPIGGDELAGYIDGLLVGFPDLSFVIESVDATSDTGAVARWRMRGTNTGPMPAGPPAGGSIDLPGIDVLTYDPDADRVATVVGYFDTATMLRQLGLQAHLTPQNMEGVTEFGIGLRIETGRTALPGALTVTWIDIDPEHQNALIDATTEIVMQELGDDDYLGACIATIGRRNYTFTAWTSVDAAKRALRGGAHGSAMRLATNNGLGENIRGITSFWEPVALNRVFSPHDPHDITELGSQWL